MDAHYITNTEKFCKMKQPFLYNKSARTNKLHEKKMEFLIFDKQKLVLFKKKSQMKTIVISGFSIIFGFSIITIKLFKKKKCMKYFLQLLVKFGIYQKLADETPVQKRRKKTIKKCQPVNVYAKHQKY